LFGVPLVAVEAVGLFVVRRKRAQVPRLVVSVALLVPLVMHTRDPLFAGVALLFVGMAFVARVFYTPRNAT
jgi:hypothetical protein